MTPFAYLVIGCALVAIGAAWLLLWLFRPVYPYDEDDE